MFQLECIQVIEVPGDPMVTVRFGLLLNGEPTDQFASFVLQPDFCEIGDIFLLTAHDFEESGSRVVFSKMADSLN